MTAEVRAQATQVPQPGIRTAEQPSLLKIGAALGVVYIVWGSTYFAIRLTIATIPPLLQAGGRFLVAGLLLYGWSLLRSGRQDGLPTRRMWLSALIVGGALLTIGNGGVSVAEQFVPSGTAALVISTTPLWMAILGAVVWRRRLHALAVAGIAIGLAGMALLVWPEGGHFRLNPIGLAVLFLAAFSWAAGSVYSKSAVLPAAAGLGTAMQMVAGGLLLLLLSLVTGEFHALRLAHVSITSLLALAYLVAFGSLAAFSSYAWLVRHADLTLVSTYAYVNPAVAVALGTVFLGEPLTLRTVIAAAVIVAGVALIVSRQTRRT